MRGGGTRNERPKQRRRNNAATKSSSFFWKSMHDNPCASMYIRNARRCTYGRAWLVDERVGVSLKIFTKETWTPLKRDTCIPAVATCVSYETCFDFLSSRSDRPAIAVAYLRGTSRRRFGKPYGKRKNNQLFVFQLVTSIKSLSTRFAIDDAEIIMIQCFAYIVCRREPPCAIYKNADAHRSVELIN
jgi:hypothetical protein